MTLWKIEMMEKILPDRTVECKEFTVESRKLNFSREGALIFSSPDEQGEEKIVASIASGTWKIVRDVNAVFK